MLTPILATKLYVPSPRPQIVSRLRLLERLDEGLTAGHKLILIAAPAGFGKTTLVSAWLTSSGRRAAWLSLDEGDSDLNRFLTYLIAAVQTVVAGTGDRVSAALQSPQPPPTETLLTALLNEFAIIPEDFVLVLDDYHLMDTAAVELALAFLVEHLPPQMHLVITTRKDPQLPLSRWRARGQLTELHAADLRFTSAEVADFLDRQLGLPLTAEDIAVLETRTEGWIAGLQLVALALQGTPATRQQLDVSSFIRSFTGTHRFILDYLVEEVLSRQSERTRSFLLQTAILDRLSGSLCTAVTGDEDSRGMLQTLERGNLFVVPLDDERRWYRYHHLFAEVLQQRLVETQPERITDLHRRASVWYTQNGLPEAAIHHALAAEDFEHAADLIEQMWQVMDISYQSAEWLGWARALPDALIRTRPVLSVGYAWALLDGGELEISEVRLQDAERWLEAIADEHKDSATTLARTRSERSRGVTGVDAVQFRSLPASIATARAYRALALGDVPGAVKYGRQALALTPEADQIRRTQATALLGIALYASGDLVAADQALTDFQIDRRKAGDILTLIGITFVLANIRMALGRLHESASVYQQALQFAVSQGEPLPAGTVDLYRGLSELYCEWDDLDTAAHYLTTARELGKQAALTGWQHRLGVAEACRKEAQEDLEGALALLDEAEHLYVESPLPNVRPIAALKARIWVMQGRLTEALAWARERDLTVDGDLSYLREFEFMIFARSLIVQYQNTGTAETISEALSLLQRLLQAAEAGGRMGSVIEILVLQAYGHAARGNTTEALKSLERALTLAEPEGYIRVFVGEGSLMAELLERMSGPGGRLKAYVHQLLAAFGRHKDARGPAIRPGSGQTPRTEPLVEPLSARELEVLKLLGTELSGPEIARELVVSLSTVRTHTQAIYTKLGVNNRRTAIRRAEELNLL